MDPRGCSGLCGHSYEPDSGDNAVCRQASGQEGRGCHPSGGGSHWKEILRAEEEGGGILAVGEDPAALWTKGSPGTGVEGENSRNTSAGTPVRGSKRRVAFSIQHPL